METAAEIRQKIRTLTTMESTMSMMTVTSLNSAGFLHLPQTTTPMVAKTIPMKIWMTTTTASPIHSISAKQESLDGLQLWSMTTIPMVVGMLMKTSMMTTMVLAIPVTHAILATSAGLQTAQLISMAMVAVIHLKTSMMITTQ